MGIFEIFRVGKQLANPTAWKQGQIAASTVATFLMGLAHFGPVFGINTGWLTPEFTNAVGMVVVTVVGVLLVPATSSKVGLLPAKPDEPVSASNPSVGSDVRVEPAPVAPIDVRGDSQTPNEPHGEV